MYNPPTALRGGPSSAFRQSLFDNSVEQRQAASSRRERNRFAAFFATLDLSKVPWAQRFKWTIDEFFATLPGVQPFWRIIQGLSAHCDRDKSLGHNSLLPNGGTGGPRLIRH